MELKTTDMLEVWLVAVTLHKGKADYKPYPPPFNYVNECKVVADILNERNGHKNLHFICVGKKR